MIREPRYEPVYLFGGAAPVSALVNRFLQAEPSPVDHVVRAGETVVIDGRPLDVLLQDIVDGVAGPSPTDDVALLALRVTAGSDCSDGSDG